MTCLLIIEGILKHNSDVFFLNYFSVKLSYHVSVDAVEYENG